MRNKGKYKFVPPLSEEDRASLEELDTYAAKHKTPFFQFPDTHGGPFVIDTRYSLTPFEKNLLDNPDILNMMPGVIIIKSD